MITKVKALYSEPDATSFDVLQFKDGRIYERYSQPQCLYDRIVGSTITLDRDYKHSPGTLRTL